MDVLTATEVDRRAWAVEQANRTAAAIPQVAVEKHDGDEPVFHIFDPEKFVLGLATSYLNYLVVPLAQANQKLLDAARGYDGTQNAAALIGALADALEAR